VPGLRGIVITLGRHAEQGLERVPPEVGDDLAAGLRVVAGERQDHLGADDLPAPAQLGDEELQAVAHLHALDLRDAVLGQRRRHGGKDVRQIREVIGVLGAGLLRPDLRHLVLDDRIELALSRAQRGLERPVLSSCHLGVSWPGTGTQPAPGT
jgi:hypothetical protein